MKKFLVAAIVALASLPAFADAPTPPTIPTIPVTGAWVAGRNLKTCARVEWRQDVTHGYMITNTDGTQLDVPGAAGHVTKAETLLLAACGAGKPYFVRIEDPARLPAPVPSRVIVDWVPAPKAG